jgi:hypothetical protein
MKTNKKTRWAVLGLLFGAATMLAGEAHAIIGRPLTPMSYAGVARRTTRRTIAATAVAAPYYGAYRW